MGREGAGSDDPVPEITATQYVILAENQRKKRALAETRLKYGQISNDNRRLLQEREELQRETYEVAEYMRKEMLAKNEKINDLMRQLEQEREDRALEKEGLEKQRTEEVEVERQAYAVLEASTQKELSELQSKLEGLADFQEHKDHMESDLVHFRATTERLEVRLKEQEEEWERKFIEHNSKMKKEYEMKLDELHKRTEEGIDDRLDASVKRILQQNRCLSEELRLHVEETDHLQHEVRILEGDRSRLMREVEMKRQLEEGYAKRSAKQQREVREAGSKIASLEQSLETLVQQFERERQHYRAAMQAQVDDAVQESQGLKRLVKLKSRELKNIRRLAQEALLQRSDVEIFLVSSLQQVRKEMEREELQLNQKASTVTPSPSVKATAMPSSSSRKGDSPPGASGTSGSSGGLDLRDMSWADRERVLRLVFAKVNNQAQQAYFSHLPAHSFDPQAENAAVSVSGLLSDAGPAQLA